MDAMRLDRDGSTRPTTRPTSTLNGTHSDCDTTDATDATDTCSLDETDADETDSVDTDGDGTDRSSSTGHLATDTTHAYWTNGTLIFGEPHATQVQHVRLASTIDAARGATAFNASPD